MGLPPVLLPQKPKNNCSRSINNSNNKNNSIKTQSQADCAAIYLYTLISFSFLLLIQSLPFTSSTTKHIQKGNHHHNHNQHASTIEILDHKNRKLELNHQPETLIHPALISFHPLKDLQVPAYTNRNKTWFMSTLVGHPTHGLPEHFVFPSQPPNDKLLCVDAHKKLYVLAKSSNSFPAGSFHVAPGLTYLADSFYDYENPWHGLNAISPFFSWRRERGQCQNPMRFVLFKRGDVVVKKVGNWVRGFMEANLDRSVTINDNELLTKGFNGGSGNKSTMVCFERAVVMRRGLGGMKGDNRQRLFDMVRCKAWRFCGVDHDVDGKDGDRLSNNNGAATSTSTGTSTAVNASTNASAVRVQVSLLVREGKRGFANETQVRDVIGRECRKLASKCELRVIHLASAGGNANRSNMSFCNQVRSMRKTDIVVTTHGGQLTNMVFMPPGSSVMEMFPTGWLEGAGPGQFIYQWFSGWSRMHYEGAWRDPHGIRCPYPNFASSITTTSTSNNKSDITNMMKRCFAIRQKNQKVGVDEVYLARWISRVLAKAIIRKVKLNLDTTSITPKCACD